MRKVLLGFLMLAVLSGTSVVADDAVGSAFGALTTAKVLGQGKANFMGAVGIADATSFVGAVTWGMSSEMDGRIKLGLIDPDGPDGDTKFTLGLDAKWQIWRAQATQGEPFDMAIGAQFEYVDFNFGSALQLGGNLLGSYPFVLTNNDILAPYARLNARVEILDIDTPGGGGSESNLELGLNAGVAWQVTTVTTFYAEFQFDGNDGLFVGIDFNVM
jgi:hypothetical protein